MHVEHICRTFLAVLEAPRELVHDQAFNVGRAQDNVRVSDVADLVRDAVPGSRVTFADGAGPDLRSYRVDFSKLHDTLPELGLHWHVQDGVDGLTEAYARHALTYDEFTSSRYVRLRRIQELLSLGLIDEMLRRTASRAGHPGGTRGSPVTAPLGGDPVDVIRVPRIADALLFRPSPYVDERGFFCRTFDADVMRAAGLDPATFIQDSQSRSARGVVRGLHTRRGDGEAKLVRCSYGAIFDVVVDLRPASPTRGHWESFELRDEEQATPYVPPGCAHGFQALTDPADVAYKIDRAHDLADDVLDCVR